MQLDLGATQTHFYENNIKELFNSHPLLKDKIDTSYIFWINGKDERLMFDTGSSIFGILTTKKTITLIRYKNRLYLTSKKNLFI